MLIRYARVRTQGKDLEPLQGALASLYLSRLTANGCSLPITTDCFWPKAAPIQHCQFWSARRNHQSAERYRKRQKLVLSLIGRTGGERLSSSFNQVLLAALILLQQYSNKK